MTTRVLLVDDNDKLRGLYRLGLETMGGMEVVGEASDGMAGIQTAGATKPDIILLDLSMPTMDGLEALGQIRSASPSSHVVVLTGFQRGRLEEIALQLGASAFLEKGIAPTQLADALRMVTAGAPPPPPALDPGTREALLRRVEQLI